MTKPIMTEEEQAAYDAAAIATNNKTNQQTKETTPEDLQLSTRNMMQATSKAIASELTAPVAQMVSDQLAVNVLMQLPKIVQSTGDNIQGFLNGALNTENLMGANPLAPYLKMAGIED